MSETSLSVVNSRTLLAVFGTYDQHVRKVRDALGVSISARGDRIHIEGEPEAVLQATETLERLRAHAQRHGELSGNDVTRILTEVSQGDAGGTTAPLEVYTSRRIQPRSAGQGRYLDSIRNHDVVLATGPAGTGKTYLAVAAAVAALKAGRIRKIVLVRPAVEAGESLGFLPGDLQAKINPYLRPLMDALREMMDHELIKRYSEEDLIEVIPLAYMRGRTLNDAFMILDEAQNTTVSQMKMFLTRMGNGSKIVASGDVTQIDLTTGQRSGLVDALERLKHVEGVGTIRLTGADIVRHPLVQRIVDAYDEPPPRNTKR
jgi:phosphate starvation-inducible PhoH-like protein